NLPTSNIDIVPTILHIHHIAAPAQMQGRIMYELLQHNTIKPMTPKKETILAETKLKQGKYQLMLERTVLGKYRYINYVSVTRVR
ncbi:MAG TPA: hypothetical protein PLL71_06885, partial [Agriterribacter sp.]|nr:hypothetical protein [Agriterribacter sp.]